MELPEKRYPSCTRHIFSWATSVERTSQNMKLLRSFLSKKALLSRKRSLLHAFQVDDPDKMLSALRLFQKEVHHQQADLQGLRLEVPGRGHPILRDFKCGSMALPDLREHAAALRPHIPLLRKYHGSAFVGLSTSLHLSEDMELDQLQKAYAAIVDAAHLEQLCEVLNGQTGLCSDATEHIYEGGMHRARHIQTLFQRAHEEELFRICNLLHHENVYAGWI
ncbi:MAG: hypothetical protein ACOCWQ_03900 [Nanoarchaeota archaeon]